MDKTLTQEDIEFMRWLDSKECEHFWEKDANGKKCILRSKWLEAQKYYNKLERLADNKTIFYSEEKWA